MSPALHSAYSGMASSRMFLLRESKEGVYFEMVEEDGKLTKAVNRVK